MKLLNVQESVIAKGMVDTQIHLLCFAQNQKLGAMSHAIVAQIKNTRNVV
jgi:hypothetical protein